MANENDIVFFAKTNYRGKYIKFGIKKDDRRRHLYIIGKTGMGKSTVLENMVIQDIRNGEGVTLVDPHGDFAEKILDYIPSYRINDVVYFNPADINYPIAFNVMETVSVEHKHLIASGLVGVFKKLWTDSWGPRLEYVLRNAILALLDYPGSTLLGVMRILVDKNFRKRVIAKIQDPVVKAFWVEEYSKYPDRFMAEAIAPIQNKVGQFLSTALIRNIVGQTKSSIDIRDIMDNRKILIMNLSKGRIGEDASALFGAMMITKVQLAAMSRIDIPENQRKDFYLYVDEFQNFATDSFANILSEARKYRLNLIMAHQYIEQVEENIQAAVFGNVGTIMCFRIGAADAEFLIKEFEPYFTEEDLVNLTKYNIYIKLMIDGVSSNPFSAETLEPLFENVKTGNAQKIIDASRERYTRPKDVVEEKIARWSENLDEEDEEREILQHKQKEEDTILKKYKENEKDEREHNDIQGLEKSKTYTVECYECGSPTIVHFRPDGIRPVYCKKCFRGIREHVLKKPSDVEKDINVQQENSSSPSEISLNEALNREPVSFTDRREKAAPSMPETRKKIMKDASQEREEENIGKGTPSTALHEKRKVRSGEVVKL